MKTINFIYSYYINKFLKGIGCISIDVTQVSIAKIIDFLFWK